MRTRTRAATQASRGLSNINPSAATVRSSDLFTKVVMLGLQNRCAGANFRRGKEKIAIMAKQIKVNGVRLKFAQHAFPGRGPVSPAKAGIGHVPGNTSRKPNRIVRRYENPGYAVNNRVRAPGNASSYARDAHGGGLERDVRKTLAVCGEDDKVACGVVPGHLMAQPNQVDSRVVLEDLARSGGNWVLGLSLAGDDQVEIGEPAPKVAPR